MKDRAVSYRFDGREYLFCCQGCVDEFIADPGRYLQETADLVVCPTCLGEKPLRLSTKLKFRGKDLHFCRCPHCVDEFMKNPEHFMGRLADGSDYTKV